MIPNTKNGLPALTCISAMQKSIRRGMEVEAMQFACELLSTSKGFVPVIPDWALDQHTQQGKRMGRGLDHFRREGAKLIPPPIGDRYEDEAYRLLELKRGKRDLFDE